MKITLSTLAQSLLFCLFIGYFAGCKPIVVINEPIQAPVGVAFIDVNDKSAQNIPNVAVHLIDTLGMVVSSNGFKFDSLRIRGGVMSIGLKTTADFTESKPYRFYIRAEAEGYMPAIKAVVIQKDVPHYVPIYMAKLGDNVSDGLTALKGGIGTLPDGVIDSQQVIGPVFGKPRSLHLTFKPQTQVLYNKKPISSPAGALTYQLMYGTPRDSNAQRVFPIGLKAPDLVDKKDTITGTPAKPAYLSPLAWFSLDMKLGGQDVNGFSQPVIVRVPIERKVLNPKTGDFITLSAGNSLPVWSLDHHTGVWTREGRDATIQGEGQELLAQFEMTHLSSFAIALTAVSCATAISVTYNTTAFAGSLYTRLANKATGADLSADVVLFSTSPLLITNVPIGLSGQLLVHSGSAPSAAMLGRTASNLTCGQSGILEKDNGVPLPQYTLLEIQYNTGSPVNHCNNSVWYKPQCADALFAFGGVLTADGKVWLPFTNNATCVTLWFMDKNRNQISLEIPINFGGSTALTFKEKGQSSRITGVINAASAVVAAVNSFKYDYIVDNTPMPAVGSNPGYQNKVTVKLKMSVIDGLGACQ